MDGRCAMPGPLRREMDGTGRGGHEAEFLPAVLALRETPPHPAPRIAMGLILLFALIALLWAVFGRIDIVASAHGKLIPDDRSKVIQSMETAAVLTIHVRDGQRVKPGDPLIEFDATQTLADTTRIGQDQLAARLEAARARALLAALESARSPRLEPALGVDARSSGRRATFVGRSAWGVARQAGTTRRGDRPARGGMAFHSGTGRETCRDRPHRPAACPRLQGLVREELRLTPWLS
jgi:hypothetical protein